MRHIILTKGLLIVQSRRYGNHRAQIVWGTYVVPPALPKVGQVHLESVLKQLKAYTEHSQQEPVPDD